MRVIVFAQDLSGRKDDGFYTKPNISEALDIFFTGQGCANYLDSDCEAALSKDVARSLFECDGRIVFYNAEGEKIVIARDPVLD